MLNVNLVTPEALFLSDEVEMIVVPSVEGDFGAMAGHSPLISMIKAGVIEIHKPNEEVRNIFCAGGYAEVDNTKCTILAEELVDVAELNKEELEKDLAQAKFDIEHAETDKEKEQIRKNMNILEAKIASL